MAFGLAFSTERTALLQKSVHDELVRRGYTTDVVPITAEYITAMLILDQTAQHITGELEEIIPQYDRSFTDWLFAEAAKGEPDPYALTYEVCSGFFVQDSPAGDNPQEPSVGFGLIDSSPTRWQTFHEVIEQRNATAPDGVWYKVFFFGRHGEGYHNVGEKKYGTQAWDDHWSKLNGDGEITWGPDPQLTPLGISQAEAAASLWSSEISSGMTPPERLYASPLTRALRTAKISFEGASLQRKITVLENLREESGVHTCDQRLPRSKILESLGPSELLRFEIEEGMTEADEFWDPDVRETRAHVASRARSVLDKIFREQTDKTYISITAHGGIINGFLEVLGRARYAVPTGGVLPVVVRAERPPEAQSTSRITTNAKPPHRGEKRTLSGDPAYVFGGARRKGREG